jgi:arsenite-transporting ATPase
VPPKSEFPLQSLTAARVVVVAGKGGVGKTTVTAVIARAASNAGQRVLVVELDGKPTLAELVPDLEVLAISAPEALDEYLRDHGFGRIAKRLHRTGVIDVVGTAAPGIDDIVVLGKIKQLERSGDYDLIVVDGPAAGHAITFLMSAAGLADAVSAGPVRAQADEVLELLHDPERCQVVLVTLAETTPVNEVVETAFALEDDVGVQLGPVVVNGVDLGDPLPDEAAAQRAVAGLDPAMAQILLDAAAFRRARRTMEAAEIARLAAELPIPKVTLPACAAAGLTSADIDELAKTLTSDSSKVPAASGAKARR